MTCEESSNRVNHTRGRRTRTNSQFVPLGTVVVLTMTAALVSVFYTPEHIQLMLQQSMPPVALLQGKIWCLQPVVWHPFSSFWYNGRWTVAFLPERKKLAHSFWKITIPWLWSSRNWTKVHFPSKWLENREMVWSSKTELMFLQGWDCTS